MERKSAIITGITGQDGYYLAEFLLKKHYKICGMMRRTSLDLPKRILDLKKDYPGSFYLRYGDLLDMGSLIGLIRDFKPCEIYNLAAQSHVKVSFETAVNTADVNGLGVLRLLEAIKLSGYKIKFYQASTSELYGKVKDIPQNENTVFNPQSPYAISKLMGYYSVINYREAYGLFACNGILFNHESPWRGEEFVTRKITKGIANIIKGNQEVIFLGNLDAKRDWGFAGDYVKAMWMMLQKKEPDDYVIASGENHSVREFTEIAFNSVGIELEWSGKAENEIGRDKLTGKILVRVDPIYYRPAEVNILLGDPGKAEKILGWKKEISFPGLVEMMVKSDLRN